MTKYHTDSIRKFLISEYGNYRDIIRLCVYDMKFSVRILYYFHIYGKHNWIPYDSAVSAL